MPLSPQETLEDLDRNKDGYVQVEEYIGEWAPISPRDACPLSGMGSVGGGNRRYITHHQSIGPQSWGQGHSLLEFMQPPNIY